MNTLPAAPDAHAIGAMLLTLSALYLFSRQWLSLESSGLATITALIVGFELFPYSSSKGPLGANDFLAGFGNPALITIVALLICSKALDVTGALHSMTRQLARFWSKQPRAALLVTMFGVATASMFMNNTPLVAMVLPILIAVCLRTQTPTSSVLMPVGYATIHRRNGDDDRHFDEPARGEPGGGSRTTALRHVRLRLPAIIAGSASILLIWFLAPYLLPDRTAALTDTSPRLFRGVLQVGEKSVAAGKTLAEIRTLTQGRMQVERIERGEDLFVARLPTVVLRPGDRLYVRGQSSQLKEFEMLLGTPLRQDNGQTSASERNWLEDKTLQRLAEIVITSSSPLYGQTVRQSPLLAQYGLSPIAVHAPKAYADDEPEELSKLENQKLRIGDVVLVQGEPESINDLRVSGQALVLSGTIDLPLTAKALPASAIMIGVILVAAFGILPIMVTALIGVVLCLATRCIRWHQVRAAVDANLVLMIVASLGMGEALMQTGATAWLAGLFVYVAGDLSPAMVLTVLMLCAALLTEVVTNNAAAVLLTPIAFGIAEALGLDPKPLVLAVMFGAEHELPDAARLPDQRHGDERGRLSLQRFHPAGTALADLHLGLPVLAAREGRGDLMRR